MFRYPQPHTFIMKDTTDKLTENTKPHFKGGPQTTHNDLEMAGQYNFAMTQLGKKILFTKQYRSIKIKNKSNIIVHPKPSKISSNAKS